MLLELFCFILTLTIFYYIYWNYIFTVVNSDAIIAPLPFIGHALAFTVKSRILYLYKFVKVYNGIYVMLFGMDPVIVLTHKKHFEMMLPSMKLSKKARQYSFLSKWLGDGQLTSHGEKWQKRRKMLTPAFNFKILEGFVQSFNNLADVLLEKLKGEAGGAFDVLPYMCRYTLDVICETAMGTSVEAQSNQNCDYVQAVKNTCCIVNIRTFSLFQRFDWFFRFTKNYQIEKRSLEIIHNYTLNVIKTRRAKTACNRNTKDEFGIKSRTAFLDLLLQASLDGKPLTDEEIREEVDTFMFAGYDTTAAALSFALFLIAKHRDVQDKILDEQKLIFKNLEGDSTFADLQAMKYLENVIKETLRLYPPVPYFARDVTESINFSGKHTFKRGCQAVFSLFILHRDPTSFPEPELFNPDRFDEDLPHPYAYLPFSAGPRNCIGQKFAMLELKAAISKVIRSFELEPAVPEHKMVLVPEATLKSENGVLIRIRKRLQ